MSLQENISDSQHLKWIKLWLKKLIKKILPLYVRSRIKPVYSILKNESNVIKKIIFNLRYYGFNITFIKIKNNLKKYKKYNNFNHEIHKYKTNIKRIIPFQNNPLISIIIPVFNQWSYTYDCICSILDTSENISYEIILANDNSTDETRNANNIFENIVHVSNEKNLGFLKNCNNAAKHARGSYVLFLNNDTQVMPDWLKELSECIQKDKKIGLVGSKLIYADGRLQEAGGIVWRDGNAWNYGRLDDPDKPEYNYIKEVDYISGASILIDKEIWDKLGGFDERFAPAYCEDSDLCFSIRKLGYKVVLNPFSVVVHFEGVSHGTSTNSGVKQYQVVNAEKFKNKWQLELQNQVADPSGLFLARDRSKNKKTILVIDHYVPTFDKDAGSRTIFNFLDTLCGLGFSVKFIGDNFYPEEPYTQILQKMGVEVLFGEYYQNNWGKYLLENNNYINFILFSRSHTSKKYLQFIKQNRINVSTLYYGHDLGFIRLEQQYNITLNKRLLSEIKDSKQNEEYMYNNVNMSLVCSTIEQSLILDFWPNVNTTLVPAYFFPTDIAIGNLNGRNGLLFVGGFSHYPNIDAMIWFLDFIYKSLDDVGMTLRIVGSNIPQNLLKYKDKFKNLEFFSNISDKELKNLYNISKIVIAPLKQGAGIKGKVIEAMSYGVPIVGTDIAYEGLPNLERLHLARCNNVDSFIEEVHNLLNNRELWLKRSQDGLLYIKQNFSKENMTSVFKDTFKSDFS